jgi:glutathione S-transferase
LTSSAAENLELYFAPDSCARVTLVALEETGHPYELKVVAFVQGQHRSAEYLALNPKGKVPTLVVNGEPLTENVAILSWLAARYPDAALMPAVDGPLARARQLADLSFCASGLHPIVTRLRIPQYFCDTPDGVGRVFELAAAAMRPNFAMIEQRLAGAPWWYGETWSVMDAYINWVWFRVTGAGFDAAAYPNFARHDAQIRRRPSVMRALAVNQKVADDLAARGLAVKFSGPGAVRAPT